MKICATCQKPVEDQIEICQNCFMKVDTYISPGFVLPSEHEQWTVFPPIPKTHWWGTELELASAGSKVGHETVTSKREGVFVGGPRLSLGVGLYEFHCFMSVSRVRRTEIGTIRVLSGDTVIVEQSLTGEDFEVGNEAYVTIGFRLKVPSENVRCEFSSNGRVNISLHWLRLVPQFAWQWDGSSENLKHNEEALVTERGITLQVGSGNNEIRLYGPWISLLPGFYKLVASITVEPSEDPLVATWEITVNSGASFIPPELMELDSSRRGKPQILSRNFQVNEVCKEVEFRIWIERGQITVHWLRLILPEGHIWERYYKIGGKDSPLGLPLSIQETSVSKTGAEGFYRRFDRGSIYFNNRTSQSWEVWGRISSLYEKLGGTDAQGIGFPIGAVQPVESSVGTVGEFQRFEGWGKPAIFVYPADRGHVCAVYGAISSKYWEIDGPDSALGFPKSENEYEWVKDGEVFRRSDFERGYIIWKDKTTIVHLSPKPHVYVKYPPSISRGEELTIKVVSELEERPVHGAWCTVSFPDPFEVGSLVAESGSQSLQVDWPNTRSWGEYGKSDNYKLQYPRIEMSQWQDNWPLSPANSFQIRLRPTRAGKFRIFARMTARDSFDRNVWGYDPHPELPGVEYDQQKEAVYVYIVQVDEPTKTVSPQHDADFAVFLCYNSEDREEVKKVGVQLKEQGISPWLDEWELQPGLPWQQLLEQQIEKIKSVAVFVGKNAIGPWQQRELDAFVREFVNRGCPVIPVLLQDAPRKPPLPIFLSGMTWVDFRRQDPDPIERLVWGITGEHQ